MTFEEAVAKVQRQLERGLLLREEALQKVIELQYKFNRRVD